MSTAVALFQSVRLILLAPAPAPGLAASLLTHYLSMSTDRALCLLNQPRVALAEGLAPDLADRLATLLSAIGLRVRLEWERPGPPDAPRFDLSLQPADGADIAGLGAGLAVLLGRPLPDLLVDLLRPGGVILRGLTAAETDRLRRSARRIKGLVVAICCPDEAVHDLFARPGARLTEALKRHLRVLGLRPCAFNGALAGGMNRLTRDHMIARFGDCLFGMERAFQRFDLYLIGSGTMDAVDLVDFLATRHPCGTSGLPRQPTWPLRIETGLPFADAMQFLTDYDMIGLQTMARLSMPAPLVENR